jgi:hypothetical protein
MTARSRPCFAPNPWKAEPGSPNAGIHRGRISWGKIKCELWRRRRWCRRFWRRLPWPKVCPAPTGTRARITVRARRRAMAKGVPLRRKSRSNRPRRPMRRRIGRRSIGCRIKNSIRGATSADPRGGGDDTWGALGFPDGSRNAERQPQPPGSQGGPELPLWRAMIRPPRRTGTPTTDPCR